MVEPPKSDPPGVLDFRFLGSAKADPQFEEWKPNALPLWIKSLSIKHGVAFIDTTPALEEELQEGNLPYNSFFDPHLSISDSAGDSLKLMDEAP